MSKELKSVFKINHDWNNILTKVELMSIFWNSIDEKIKESSDIVYFEKIGSLLQTIDFPFKMNNYYCYDSRKKINMLDEEKFIGDALRAIKRCRTIDDELYRKIDSLIINEKEYIIANKDEPLCKIIEVPTEHPYILKPIIFSSYNKRNILKHIPNLDKQQDNKLEIELFMNDKKEGGFFIEMYYTIIGKYETKGFGLSEVK